MTLWRTTCASLGALALAACATTQGGDSKTASASSAINKDPYPSTYRAYPGAPTALVGATVFDGAGGRINGGTVLFEGGKVVGVGGSDLAIPAGYTSLVNAANGNSTIFGGNADGQLIGLRVDAIGDLIHPAAQTIEPPPAGRAARNDEPVSGVVPAAQGFVALLDIGRLCRLSGES